MKIRLIQYLRNRFGSKKPNSIANLVHSFKYPYIIETLMFLSDNIDSGIRIISTYNHIHINAALRRYFTNEELKNPHKSNEIVDEAINEAFRENVLTIIDITTEGKPDDKLILTKKGKIMIDRGGLFLFLKEEQERKMELKIKMNRERNQYMGNLIVGIIAALALLLNVYFAWKK